MLNISVEEKVIKECTSVIIVPEKAIDEHGYIQTISPKSEPSTKHEFHALAQMAYYQYQDEELEIEDVGGEIRVTTDDATIAIDSGLVLYRRKDGSFSVLVHENLNSKKLLEAAFRFCTRWIRLDI